MLVRSVNVKQLQASVAQAEASVHRAVAQFQLAQQTHDRQAQLLERHVASQAAVDTAARNLEAARQSVASTQATLERAQLAFTSNIDGVNTTAARRDVAGGGQGSVKVAQIGAGLARLSVRGDELADDRSPSKVLV